MEVAVLLQPIGRVEQIDPPDHRAKEPRVGTGDPVDHRPQEQGKVSGWVGDVDRLTPPETSPVPVLVGDRLVAALEILADRLVEPPSQIVVIGRGREKVGQP